MEKPHGLAFSIADAPPTFLPLKFVSVKAQIVDVSARVEITQVFQNVSESSNATAQYLFPVPANAAVCAFSMHSSDGRVLKAVVKTLEEARKEYQEAVANDMLAGLLEEVSGDVFTLSIGAIPTGLDITTKISYVQELEQDDLANQVRFHLHTYIGKRYGEGDAAFSDPSSSTTMATIRVRIEVRMASYIERIASPSHEDEIYWTDVEEEAPKEGSPVYSSTVTFQPQHLNKDFVLSVRATNFHRPRCLAEVDNTNHTVALSLTHVPKFGAEPIANQEYVFVIDKSTSMKRDNRLQNAKNALQILLKSLPEEETFFNLVWYSGQYSELWTGSQRYNEYNLQHAIENIEQVLPNRGTEIESTLRFVFDNRSGEMPTSVFVLTDGLVKNEEGVFRCIRSAMEEANANNSSLRVFCLGIGDGISDSLCRGIARHGRGICEMATNSEDIATKCASLLHAARYPPFASMYNISFDWGYHPSPMPKSHRPMSTAWLGEVATFLQANITEPIDEDDDMEIGPKRVVQAPSCKQEVFDQRRFTISAILRETIAVPGEVLIHGTLRNEEQSFISVPVQIVKTGSTLHTLAARRLITELLDAECDEPNETIKTNVERLSTIYQLASKYAAFVAVDDGFKVKDAEEIKEELDFAAYHADRGKVITVSDRTSGNDDYRQTDASNTTIIDPDDRMAHEGGGGRSDVGSVLSAGITEPSRTQRTQGGNTWAAAATRMYHQASHIVSATFFTLCVHLSTIIQPGSGCCMGCLSCCCSCCRSDALAHDDSHAQTVTGAQMVSITSGVTVSLPYSSPGGGEADRYKDLPLLPPLFYVPEGKGPVSRVQPIDRTTANERRNTVTAVARLQSYDGSFQLNGGLVELLNGNDSSDITLQTITSHVPESISDEPKADIVWATVLAVTYLRTRVPEESDLWVGLCQKAMDFVLRTIDGDEEFFMALVYEAGSLITPV